MPSALRTTKWKSRWTLSKASVSTSMASIYLVRHAQASFGTDDYDRLSSIGIRQARLAGRHLLARTRSLRQVVTGSLKRHKDTATELLASSDASCLSVERKIDERFDELDTDAQIRTLCPESVRINSDVVRPVRGSTPDGRTYQQTLKQALLRWQAMTNPPHPLESWSQFQSRLISGFEDLKSGNDPGETTIVVSSAGVIACIVLHILGLPADRFYCLFEVMNNGSITHILHDRRRTSVASFNDCSYLYLDEAFRHDEKLLTYR
jgi:broad specificity phosphatase PhoE